MQDKDNTTSRFGSEGANVSPDFLSGAKPEPVISDIQKPSAMVVTNPLDGAEDPSLGNTTVQSPASFASKYPPVTQLTSTITPPSSSSQSLGFARFKPLLIAALFIFGVGLAGFLGYKQLSSQGQNSAISTDPAAAYDIQKLDLQDLADTSSLGLATSQSLSVNGQLRTNNSLVLAPTTQPTSGSATPGQIYYDQTGNVLAYYNGTQFVDVASTDQLDALRAQIQSLGSSIPTVPTLPSDLATLGATNTFQSLNTFSGGLATSSLSTGSLSVASAANLQGSLTVAGNTTLGPTTASSLVLASPLAVNSGGTGTNTLSANGVVLGNGTNPLTTATYSAGSQCLMSPVSGTGAPIFGTCPGGVGSGVNSLNGLAGNLTIANATSLGSTITLNDATTLAKGIASFNATNFSVSGGVVNTIQNLSTTSSPTFAGVSATTLTGNGAGVTNVNAAQLGGQAGAFYQNATNINTGTLADARLSANVALLGALTSNFTGTLQQGGNNVCTAANNCGYLTGSAASGSYIQLQATTPGTAQTGNLNISGTAIAGVLYQGANQVCDTSGNCAGAGGGLVGSGTAGAIAKFTASGTLGNSIITENLTTVTVGGTLAATTLTGNGAGVTNVNAAQLGGQAGAFYQNATNINTGTLADARLSANVALLGALTSNFTGTLQQGGNNVCTAANNCGYLTGSAASGSYIQLQATTPGTAQTGNLNISGTAIAGAFSGSGASLTALSATNISAGTLADARLSANVALLNTASNTFAGTLAIQGSTGVTLGVAGITQGKLTLATTGVGSATLQSAAQSANITLNIPTNVNLTDTLCLQTLANCSGSGVTVSGTATDGRLTKFNATGQILNSNLSETSTTLTYSGNSIINAATGFLGNLLDLQLNGVSKLSVSEAGNTSIAGTLAVTGTVTAANINATTALQLNGVNINTAGTLTNVAYLNQANTFSAANTFSTSVTTPLVQSAALAALTLTGNAASTLSTTAGNLTLQAGSGTISLGTTTALSTTNSLTVISGTTLALQSTGINAVSLDSGTTGAINIGTGANAKAITIGNTTTTTGVAIQGGSGGILFTATTATASGNLVVNNGLYTGTGAGTLRISSAGALSNVSIPTASTVTVGSAGAFGILYTNSSNVLQFANINGAYASTTKCLMSDGTTGLGFGTCPAGSGGSGWGLTGNAGTIVGTNFLGTSDNQAVMIKSNSAAPTPSYIQINSSSNDSIGAITIAGNGPAGSSGGGTNWFEVKQAGVGGGTFFGISGSGTTARVQMYLQPGSNIGVQSKVCSTNAVGSAGLATMGVCTSTGTDLAESYNSTQSLEPGDIVSVDPNNYPNVLRSDHAQQDNLVGIVSTDPDYVMGEGKTPDGYPIALNGRVPTKVNAEGGPILPGDKITSSSVPGVGKKATGRGMIVGTALTGYSGTGQGVIEVFVHLDYYEPPQIDMLQANAANIGDLNVSGTATLENLVVEGNATVYSIMVKGHIITSSGQPVADVREAAGSGAIVTIDGNDTAGTIKITTGASGLMIGDLASFIFSETYSKVPRIVMTGQDGVSIKVGIYPSAKSLTGFTLQTNEVLLPDTTYTFDYFIVE